MSTPLVSVAITTYKRPHFLREAIHSVLRQTWQDFEIVIGDDNSQDETAQIVREFQDPRIRYYCHAANLGQIQNTNYCLRQARGKYFCWNSDDNVFLPQFLEKLAGALEDHAQAGAAVCSTIVADVDLRPFHVWSVGERVTLEPGNVALLNFFLRQEYTPSSALYRREAVIANGGLDETIHDDWAWLGRYVYRYGCIRIPDPLVCLRDHTSNMSKTLLRTDKDPIQDLLTNYDAIYASVPEAEKELWQLRGKLYRRVGRHAWLAGIGNLRRRRLELAKRQFFEAIHTHPLGILDPFTLWLWFQVRASDRQMRQAKLLARTKAPVLVL